MKAALTSLFALVLLTNLSGTARAQVFTPSTPVTGDSSVLTAGTEVWGGTAIGRFTNSTYVLGNGVTFNDNFNNSNFVSDPNSTVQVDQDGAAFADQTGNLGLSDSVLNNALSLNQAASGQLFLNIKGLTPGHVYVVQYFDALTTAATGGNINNAGTFNATETVTHEEGFFSGPETTSTLAYGQTPDPANPGQFLDSGAFTGTDTFTANANGTAFVMFSNSTNGIDLLAAAQIRDLTIVPEPSTYAMLFAGLALLGFSLRKHAVV